MRWQIARVSGEKSPYKTLLQVPPYLIDWCCVGLTFYASARHTSLYSDYGI